MQEVFWNLKRNKQRYIDLWKSSDKDYCIECNKPLRNHISLRCSKCTKSLFETGLEPRAVTFGQVGLATVNYQQYLHRSFFGCNAPYKYRGNKQDRIKMKIDQQELTTHTNSMIRILESRNTKHTRLYKEVRHMHPNVSKRLLYNILLHYIAYFYSDTNPFNSEAHFCASVMKHIHSYISNTHIRTTGIIPTLKVKSGYKCNGGIYMYRLFEELDGVMGRLIGEL